VITNWTWRGRRGPLIGAAAVAVALAGGAAVVASGAIGAHRHNHGATPPTGVPLTQAYVSAPASATRTTRAAQRRSPPARPRRHGPATRITHTPQAHVADATAGVAIRFNGDPAPDTPRPSLEPHIAGHWTTMGPYEVFHPVSTLTPCANFTLHVPAGTFVLRHRTLGTAQTIAFTVDCPGITATQEALARLGYLPYALRGSARTAGAATLTRKQAARSAYALPDGKLVPNVKDAPPLAVGTLDATTTGALQVYEGDHNLPITTTPSAALWSKLLADETLGRRDPKPYTWVTVTKTIPETLEVHQGAKVALSSPTNTGVPGADTQDGIFPIYLRYVATTMIGTNVDGSHYNDPGVPWVNYFNGGDAVHGYVRPGYGYPQSNGCVELPISTAQTVYGMLQLGDLVIVS